MINVKNKRCITCNIQKAIYNLPKETKALYCSECKTSVMINIRNSNKNLL